MLNSLQRKICIALVVSSQLFLAFFANGSSIPQAKLTFNAMVSPQDYKDILQSLTDHINGVAVLSDAELAANHDLLLANMEEALTTDSESVAKSFELIALFDATYQAIFVSNNTKNGFNKQYSGDGLNLHRNMVLIQQGLIDFAYHNAAWLDGNPGLLDGKFFQTCHYFPGFVDVPTDPNAVENVTVKCAYMLASGTQPWANIGNENVVRPTGCYLAPGSIAEVIVPPSLLGKGIKIRVGAHYWDLSNKSNFKRFDRVSIVYDVSETITKIANPLGGGIYVEIPLGVDEGLVEIALKNVVRSPFYSKKTFHETSLTEWLQVERNRQAPWADFESDKFMMQVPTSWIYNFDDPETLMEEWDKSMDVVSDLLGRPRVADRHKNYLQFDVLIRGGAYFPGYPMSNTPYNPNSATNGIPTHPIMLGPAYGHDTHFHELGHEVAISKFAGETEAIVNLLYVPVLNKCYDISIDSAFYLSFADYWPYLPSTRDNITRTRLISDTFHEGLPRNTCNCNKNEVRYQHRGYAHYVDVAEMFGWEALEAFWKSESDAADAGMPFPVNDQPQDDRIFRMSKAVGVDLRPLFHFWGIHPNDQAALAQKMADNNIPLSDEIKCRLHQYRQLIPADYNAFVAFSQELYPNFLNYSGNNFDYGEGWFYVTAQTYDEDKAASIHQVLSDILILYYGNDGSAPALNLTCLGIAEENNAGVVNSEGIPTTFCGSLTFAPVVEFGNFSLTEMTSISVELYVNGTLNQNIAWTGSLNTLEYGSLTFNDITITETSEIEFRITSVNGMSDGNASDNTLFVEVTEVNHTNFYNLTLEIHTDTYPGETSWDFRDNAGNLIAQGGGYTVQDSLYEEAITIPADDCYTFTIYDSYGDGICCSYGLGYYRLLDPDGIVLFEGGEFVDEFTELFGVEGTTAVKELEGLTELRVFPVPASDHLKVQFSLAESMPLDVVVFNTLGQQLAVVANDEFAKGIHSLDIDVSRFSSGIYFVRFSNGRKNLAAKFTVLK